ncbi:ATP-binding cassette domain-containing protein [Amycolatopsis acidicola]|uniref:ATP-binding cassette domain-containing protein n=1 Tax=Amycolatopsis acidicola TaxID=2596893 RepID=A0A5N0VIF1_9PSEU|nr:ATP-binding cassette domain-containing protein [Amycolatopsis acidicola]KAA9164481.1 ATP-binding cassette domain-containing protein [Amycolatopsis acidicola]
MSLFEATGVGVRYGAVRALDTVDISLAPGVVHGVIGPNGAGKSTFLDALSGRVRLASGTVRYVGEDITRRSPRWRRHRGIARSFQRTSVFGSMTVRAQLELVARRHGADDLPAIVEALELGPVLDRVCAEIAYGTQRGVDLALALIGGPKVVLLDEPCAGLVADESVRLLDHVRALCTEREVAVVLVEHDVDGVFRVCDEITVLDLGSVLARGTPAQVRADEAVVRAYLGSAA